MILLWKHHVDNLKAETVLPDYLPTIKHILIDGKENKTQILSCRKPHHIVCLKMYLSNKKKCTTLIEKKKIKQLKSQKKPFSKFLNIFKKIKTC